MGEITAVAAARAAVVRNDAQNIRDREETERLRLAAQRQDETARARLDVQQLDARRQVRNENLRTDIRTEEDDDRFFDAQRQSRTTQIRDDELAFLIAEIEEELLRADDLNENFDRPPLNPTELVGSVRTPEDIRIARELATPPFEFPEPLAANAEPPRAAPAQTLAETEPLPLPAQAAPLEPLAQFDRAPAPAADPQDLAQLESQRAQRLADRAAEERSFNARQDIDLRLAQDQAERAAFDPGLPRGSVVDVFG